jgi:hypothetical protein
VPIYVQKDSMLIHLPELVRPVNQDVKLVIHQMYVLIALTPSIKYQLLEEPVFVIPIQ